MASITETAGSAPRSPTTAVADFLRQTVSVSDILRKIWSGRWLVIAGLILGLCDGAYTVWNGVATYTATMRVSPAESDLSGGGGGAGSILADLTGSASTASVPKFTQFTMGVGSVGVAELLDKRYDMLCRVFSGDCDIKTHTWSRRTGWHESIDDFFAWLGHLPDPNGPRTIIDLANYMSGSVIVDQGKQNAVANISFTSTKPKFAAEFISTVVQATNDYIKQRNHDVQRKYVDYLTATAARTTNVEQRQAIDALLLQDERQLMLTEVDVPYAAQIMDGPTVIPVNNVRKTLALYALIGMLIGTGVAACRDLVPRRWRF